MKTIDFSYFIERFNSGEMNDNERQWFLKELEQNEDLQKEVNLRKQTDRILKNQKITTLRNKMAEIEKIREIKAANSRNSKKFIYMKYAAVIAGLILLGGSITLLSVKKIGNEEIISQYYRPYIPTSEMRSAKSDANSDFIKALEFYNTHDYENAAILFNKVIELNPIDMQAVLLYGVVKFEDRKYPEAQKSFGKVISDDNNLFIETAKWYLAMCYVMTDEIELAIRQLELIRNEGGIHSSDAKKIIRKLKHSE